MRLVDAIDQYQTVRAHQVSAATQVGDAHILNNLRAGLGGSANLSHISSDDLEAFFYGPDGYLGRADPVSAATFNCYLARIRGFFKYARAKGWTDHDPFVMIPRKRETKRDRLRLTAEEVVRCIDLAGNPRDRMAVALAANLALRSGEVTGIRIRDIDLQAGSLLVHVTKSSIEDWMPITSDLDAELRRWLSTYQDQCGPLDPDWYLIPARSQVQRTGTFTSGAAVLTLHPELQPTQMQLIVQRPIGALGYPTAQEGFHTIRRSVARIYFDMLSAEGVDGALLATSSLLHHADTGTTLRYIGLKPEEERRDARLRGMPFLSRIVQTSAVQSITGTG